jgi:hypothetical protein
MTKFITTSLGFCFFALFSFTASAQLQVGVRGGVHGASASLPEGFASFRSQLEPTYGATGGLFLEVPLSDYVSFRPEINYLRKGVSVSESFDLDLGVVNLPLGATVAYQSQQIQVPLLAKFTLGDGAVRPYILAGPAVSYAFDSRVRTRATALFSTQPMDLDLGTGGMLSDWDASAIGGLGLSFPAGSGTFFAEARYEYGFTRQIQVPILNVNVRNRGASVSLGMTFPIGN